MPKIVKTVEEAGAELRAHGVAPFDECTILRDGRRLETADDVRAWAAEMAAERAAGASERT